MQFQMKEKGSYFNDFFISSWQSINASRNNSNSCLLHSTCFVGSIICQKEKYGKSSTIKGGKFRGFPPRHEIRCRILIEIVDLTVLKVLLPKLWVSLIGNSKPTKF